MQGLVGRQSLQLLSQVVRLRCYQSTMTEPIERNGMSQLIMPFKALRWGTCIDSAARMNGVCQCMSSLTRIYSIYYLHRRAVGMHICTFVCVTDSEQTVGAG